VYTRVPPGCEHGVAGGVKQILKLHSEVTNLFTTIFFTVGGMRSGIHVSGVAGLATAHSPPSAANHLSGFVPMRLESSPR
jgi:hypothetical protein